MPAGVPAATLTLPVAVSNTRPAGTAPGATDRVALLGLAATPLTVSAVNALTTAVAPARPLIPVALSLVATMTASTVSVSVDSLFAALISNAPAGAATRAVLTAVWAIAAPGMAMAMIGAAVPRRRTRVFRRLPESGAMLVFSMIRSPGKSK